MRRPDERTVESIYPWVGGLAALLLAFVFLRPWSASDGPKVLVDPIVNVAAIAIAFLIAVAVMLAPLKAEPVIRELQRIDAFPVLLSYLKSGIYAWAAVIVLSLVVKAVPAGAIAFGSLFDALPAQTATFPRVPWLELLTSLWVASLVCGALAGHRIVQVLFAFLRYRDPRIMRQQPPEQPGGDDGPLALPPERLRRAAR